MKLKMISVVFFAVFFLAHSAFAVRWTFQPRVSGTEEYTSNVFLSEDNEEDDWITTFSAGFTAQALAKNSELQVDYEPSYSFYKDFDENDGWRHDARLRGFSNLSQRMRFDIRNDFLRTQDPLDDEDILILREESVEQEGDPTIRQGRRTFYRNTASSRLSYRFGRDDLLYAGFLWGFLRNDDPQEENNDRYEPRLGLNYWFGPKFGVETNATYTRGEFDQDNDFVGDPSDDFKNYAGSVRFIYRTKTRFSIFAGHRQAYRDFDNDVGDSNDYMVYAPSAGFTYVVDKGLNVRLGAGYFYQDVDDEEDEQGLFGDAQIDRTWEYRRGLVNLTALTGLEQRNFGSQNIGLERFIGTQGLARYDFLRNLSGDINGRYRFSNRVGDADRPGDDDTGKNVHRYNVGAGLEYLPLKWMTIRLGYTFRKVISDNDSDEYDEHRGLLRVTLTTEQPFRTK
jgi:opacity protein-like surface antigen